MLSVENKYYPGARSSVLPYYMYCIVKVKVKFTLEQITKA